MCPDLIMIAILEDSTALCNESTQRMCDNLDLLETLVSAEEFNDFFTSIFDRS